MRYYGRLFPIAKTTPDRDRLATLARHMLEVGDSPDGFSSIPAGYTYLGQFIIHDLSFERLPPGDGPVDPGDVENSRDPRLDLDSLYGGGPQRAPFLYSDDGARMRIGWSDLAHGQDLPRTAPGKGRRWALIGDPRNDENLIISQLHLAFIKFHNRVVDVIEHQDRLAGPGLFEAAARSVRHHYQWAVVHDFLRRLVSDGVIQEATSQQRGVIFSPGKPLFMPVEFSAAAFRFGHSMVRREYMLEPWFSFPFLSADPRQQDLRGARERPPGTLITDWSVLFGPGAQLARKIDVHIVRMLGEIPSDAVGGPPDGPTQSLPLLDLLKATRLGLPTGQDVANALRLPEDQVLRRGDFPELTATEAPPELEVFCSATPLWYYCLKEAERFGNGSALGPVGGRIVANVLIELLRADPESYLSAGEDWRPEMRFGARETAGNGGARLTFGIQELLDFASGQLPARREPFARALVPVVY
jgi:hypothetical protein